MASRSARRAARSARLWRWVIRTVCAPFGQPDRLLWALSGCAGLLLVAALGSAQDRITPSRSLSALIINSVDGRTIADNAMGAVPATLTLTPSSSYVEIDCEDADTCDVTLGETGITEGMLLTIVNISGTETVDFADTAGVSEIAGAFASGPFDVLTLRYTGTTWVEVSRSNN